MVKCQVDVICGIDFLVFDDSHRFLERSEITSYRLVNQRSSIRQKESPFFQATFPQTVDDLEGSMGFPRTGGHNEQMTISTLTFCHCFFGNGFHRTIDCYLLVVAGRSIRPSGEVVLRHNRFGGIRDVFKGDIFFPQEFRRREGIEREFGLDIPRIDGAVVKQKRIAIAAENKRYIKILGVIHRLLNAGAD